MYYITTFIKTGKGVNINGSALVTEEGKLVLRFSHGTDSGYRSKKPLLVDFEHSINEYGEIGITDEVAADLISKYSGLTFKIFETSESKVRSRNMAGMLAWASVMGDHGDTSGQFSR